LFEAGVFWALIGANSSTYETRMILVAFLGNGVTAHLLDPSGKIVDLWKCYVLLVRKTLPTTCSTIDAEGFSTLRASASNVIRAFSFWSRNMLEPLLVGW
jgi:hypothetical protein